MSKQNKKLSAKDLTLNIAVNLGRISRWAMEGKIQRVNQFLIETEEYINQLENVDKNPKFQSTFNSFKNNFIKIKSHVRMDQEWAEDTLTWANILTHRAKLA